MTALTRAFLGPKDPDEVCDYAFNWFDRWVSGDAFSTVTWTLGSGLTLASQPSPSIDLAGESVLTPVFISGGTHGQNYDVRCRVVTTGGRTYEQTATLEVRNR